MNNAARALPFPFFYSMSLGLMPLLLFTFSRRIVMQLSAAAFVPYLMLYPGTWCEVPCRLVVVEHVLMVQAS